MKNNLKVILFYVALIALILVAISFFSSTAQSEELKYSDILSHFQNENVDSFTLDKNNKLTLTLKDSTTVSFKLRDYSTFEERFADIAEQQYKDGIITSYDIDPYTEIPWWVSFLPYVIVIVFFIILWVIMMNQATGKGGKISSFGKARAKLGTDEKKKVYFTDVAGADEEKEELREVVEFLKNPQKFVALGARIPRGVLLVGPPGTGKTLLAKAVAGEAGVPFYSISGSDFVEMYVGVGASRVRDLFETARRHPASIVFIDEIDAVGRHRGAGLGGGHDEREQTLNQLLVEMDGFGTHEGVIVMAATNRPDILDPALLRPGRFDRQITVHYPDLRGREEILRVHAKKKPFEKDVDLHEIARTTVGFTGADLANLLNEAALLAARKNKHLIGMNDIEEASIKIIVGTAKKTNRRNAIETKMTAYHEAGHAIAHFALPLIDPVQQISIIPTATTGGYTLAAPEEDHFFVSREKMRQEIVSLLGGRVAEFLIFNDFTTGASNDIQRATSIARNMVTKYGMSDRLGSIVYGTEHESDEVFLGRDFSNSKNYSDQTAAEIDNEIKRIVDEAYQTCTKILQDNIDKLHFIAEFLVSHETMDAVQFKSVMEGNPTVEELEALVAEKKRRSDEENRARAEAEAKARAQDEENRRKREAQERLEEEKRNARHPNPMEFYAEQYREEQEKRLRELEEASRKHAEKSDEQQKDAGEEDGKNSDGEEKEENGEKTEQPSEQKKDGDNDEGRS